MHFNWLDFSIRFGSYLRGHYFAISHLFLLHEIKSLNSFLEFSYNTYYDHNQQNNDNDKDGKYYPDHRVWWWLTLILILILITWSGPNLFGYLRCTELRKQHFLVGIIEPIILGRIIVVPSHHYFSSHNDQYIWTLLKDCFQIVDVLS